MKLISAYNNILAGIITTPKLYYQNSNIITDELFMDRTYLSIFTEYKKVLTDGKKPSVFNISGDVTEQQLTDIIINADTSAFAESVSFAIEHQKKEALKTLLKEAQASILHENETDSIITLLEKRLFEINDVKGNDIVPFTEQVDEFLRILENPDELKGIQTGFSQYDDFSGGLTGGDLVIVAGETSQGKTSLSLNMGLNASKESEVVFFSYEMTEGQLISRLTSNLANISSKKIMGGNLEDTELDEIRKVLQALKLRSISIHKPKSSDVDYLVNSIKAYKMMKDVKIVVVDYLQLISKAGNEGKADKIGYIARRLKNLAIELDITVILLSQLSRDRDNPTPKLSRLRASGEIEEAADQVIFIYRPEVYKKDILWNNMPSKGMAEMIIAKGRNIGRGRFAIKFTDYLTKFENYDAISDGSYQEASYSGTDNGYQAHPAEPPF